MSTSKINYKNNFSTFSYHLDSTEFGESTFSVLVCGQKNNHFSISLKQNFSVLFHSIFHSLRVIVVILIIIVSNFLLKATKDEKNQSCKRTIRFFLKCNEIIIQFFSQFKGNFLDGK
jgi:hypothetical protein